jgi:hypothetical protein
MANRISSATLRRRPSAAMLVALLALFLAAAGASYAAASLPAGSVGTPQIKNGSVTNFKLGSEAVGFRKIIPGTIGAVRVNKNAVQLRVSGACVGGAQAITSIQNTGRVTCGPTSPSEYNGGQPNPVWITSSTTATAITGVSLPGNSSFLVLANPQVQVNAATSTAQQVSVTCTLAVGVSSSATQARSVSYDLNAAHEQQTATLPFYVPVGPSTTAQGALITCVRSVSGGTGTPTVTAAATINAIQTATNTTLASTVSPPPAQTTTTTTTTTPTTTTTTPTTTTTTPTTATTTP